MNLVAFSQWVIETQGIVAFLLLVVIIQNYLYTKRLMNKKEDMERFIMECLKTELGVYHPVKKDE